jgi:peptidoglycan/LPS O-acetylase OafA/YrhL
VPALDLLRAVASLAVCWFHFAGRDDGFLPAGILQTTGQYFWLGVEAFFVVSGFVIPWALYRAGYRLQDYGRFLLKRIIRLDPPYLISIALVLTLGFLSTLSPLYRGEPFLIDWTQVGLHLGYLNVFFADKPWLNSVYSTLAIEFEYYLLIGLLFPLLSHHSAGIRRAVLTLFVLSCVPLVSEKHLPHYAPLFALGIIAFQLRTGLIGRSEATITTVLVALVGLGASEPLFVAVGLPSLAVVLFVRKCPRGVEFFGRISYSMYLLHIPLGSRVINLGLNWSQTYWAKLALIAAAYAVTIGAAYLFYRVIEKPSAAWSKRIRYSSHGPRDRPTKSSAHDHDS